MENPIKTLKISCHKILNLFKLLSHKSCGADLISLLRLCTMLLKPKLDYGSEAYGSASKCLFDSLDPIQNEAIRIATGAFRSSPSGLKRLSPYRDSKLLNYYMRLCINRYHFMHSTLIRNDDMGVEANPEMDPVSTRSTFLDRGKFLRKTHKINLMHIISEPPLLTAPWNLANTLVCNEMTNYKRNDYPTEQLKILFNSHLHIHAGSHLLYTDGSKTED